MATAVLRGGLGNQLFQYAVGRVLSNRTSSNLHLETSLLTQPSNPNLTPRTFQLSKFNIRGSTTHRSIKTNSSLRLRLKLFSLLSPIAPELAAQVCNVHRDHHSQRFAPYVLDLPGDVLLFGHYQSEKYFRDFRDTLLTELSVQQKPSSKNRTWMEKIETSNSLGVHVRRGDYVPQGWNLPAVYYHRAIREARSRLENVNLFFFSDDIEWVREHTQRMLPDTFPTSQVQYVDCNDQEAHEDLRLMRSCDHNIIANSTFSWWGAWLNQHDEKLVFAPAYWIRDRVENLDIIPKRWSVIDWR